MTSLNISCAEDARKLAKSLSATLQQQYDIRLSHSKSLNVIAGMSGKRNWAGLKKSLDVARSSQAVPPPLAHSDVNLAPEVHCVLGELAKLDRDNEKPVVLITGLPGAGKTTLGNAICLWSREPVIIDAFPDHPPFDTPNPKALGRLIAIAEGLEPPPSLIVLDEAHVFHSETALLSNIVDDLAGKNIPVVILTQLPQILPGKTTYQIDHDGLHPFTI